MLKASHYICASVVHLKYCRNILRNIDLVFCRNIYDQYSPFCMTSKIFLFASNLQNPSFCLMCVSHWCCKRKAPVSQIV